MITIYSKPGCPYCVKIKKVMELEELQHVSYELNRDFTREEFYAKFGDGATFPQASTASSGPPCGGAASRT